MKHCWLLIPQTEDLNCEVTHGSQQAHEWGKDPVFLPECISLDLMSSSKSEWKEKKK